MFERPGRGAGGRRRKEREGKGGRGAEGEAAPLALTVLPNLFCGALARLTPFWQTDAHSKPFFFFLPQPGCR